MQAFEHILSSFKEEQADKLISVLVSFFDFTGESVILLDIDKVIACNNTLCIKLGITKDDIIYQSLSSIVFKEDLSAALYNIYRDLPEPIDFIKCRFILKDKSAKWFQFKSHSIALSTKVYRLLIIKDVDNLAVIQNKLSLVLEAAHEGYWDWNLTTGEVYYDDQWLKILGYAPQEVNIYPTFWEDQIHPADKETVLKTLNAHLNNELSNYQTEHRLKTKQGDYIWVLDIGQVIERDKDQKPVRIIGITLDINNRVTAEQKLLNNEERFRSIVEHLSDGFCRFKFDGTIIEANDILVNLLKLESQSLIGRKIQEFLPAKTIKSLLKLSKKIVKIRSLTTETDIVNLSGKRLSVSISAKLVTLNKERIIQALIRDITSIREFEKILIEEKQKFKLLVENSPEMMLRLDRTFRALYISPNFKEITPKSIAELLGKHISELGLPQNIYMYIEQSTKSIFKKPRPHSISFSYNNENRVLLYEAILTPERGEQNVVESVLITFRNVTEKTITRGIDKNSSKQLEEAEKIVHFGSFEYDLIDLKFDFSAELYNILDLHPDVHKFRTEDLINYVHPDDRALVQNEISKSITKINSLNFTFRYITPAGTEKYLHCLAKFIFGSDDQPIRLNGTILDITEKRRIQELFANERDSLQTIMDNVPDAIYFKNANGQYLRVNNAFTKLAGFSDTQNIVGKTDFEIFNILKATESFEEDQNIISTGNPLIDKQEIFLIPTGEKLWFSSTKVGIHDAQGKISQIVGISRDVTQFITAGEELKRAKEKAEQADRLKSAFLANMSHEIRTPINGILGFASLLEMKEFPRDKEKKYLSIINNSGKLLLNLINDIIDLAKIEAGQLNIDKSLFELNGTMKELKEFYLTERSRRSKDQIEIRLAIEDEEDNNFILSDANRLKQILNNLISNSIKFTDQGFVEFGYFKQTGYLLFYVKDTGTGISEKEKEIVFERFKQADMGSRKKEGTGLGLAISKGLVELLGGEIWLDSEPGHGSTFYFTFPVQETEIAISPAPLTVTNKTCTSWENFSVLLVEDEEANYIYVKELLSESGLNILHATTGEDAVKLCSEYPEIALVLMDIRLPGINGFEALSKIRQFRKSLPIIAQTAFAMENEREYCLKAGCDDYISKPFDQETLFKLLDRFLSNSKN